MLLGTPQILGRSGVYLIILFVENLENIFNIGLLITDTLLFGVGSFLI